MAGSMSRKFLGLIVNEPTPGFKSLRFINLTRQKFFYDDASSSSASACGARSRDAAATTSPNWRRRRLSLPRPSFTFRPGDSDAASDEWGMRCFPLGDRKVVCMDQSGLTFALDAETRLVSDVSGLLVQQRRCRPKRTPLSLPSFSTLQIRNRRGVCDSSLFVMERFPEPEAKASGQFEAFFDDTRFHSNWARRFFRPPPFAVARNKGSSSSSAATTHPVEITAYTVVGLGRGRVPVWGGYLGEGGDSCICVSAAGAGAGTYCMRMSMDADYQGSDPNAWTWTQVGSWTLPFRGRAEYVPELKLWLGFCAQSRRLAAADLSAMDSLSSKNREPPRLLGTWDELDDGTGTPKEWRECRSRDPQLVSLGSGRFCIARFFKTTTSGEEFAVLTGVELVPCRPQDEDGSQAGGHDCAASGSGSNGKVVKLRMIKHKSRRLHGGGTVDKIF